MLDATAESISKGATHPGMCIVMFAGSRQGDTMDLKESDQTNPHRKMRRHTRRLDGTMSKTIIWFETIGAERIPQKSIKIMRSAYKKTIQEYWYWIDKGQPDRAARYAERAQHMSKYVKSPDPDTEPHVSLKK